MKVFWSSSFIFKILNDPSVFEQESRLVMREKNYSWFQPLYENCHVNIDNFFLTLQHLLNYGLIFLRKEVIGITQYQGNNREKFYESDGFNYAIRNKGSPM